MDRSPLHSDTETESESDHLEPPETDSERSNLESLKGATENVDKPERFVPLPDDSGDSPEDEPDLNDVTTPDSTGGSELHGATSELCQEDLAMLRQELELSDDNENTATGNTGGSTESVKGATCPKGCNQERTLEDALWKESASEFLIVDDSVLNLPDCSLSIKSLSDREIEIQLNLRSNEFSANKELTESTPNDDIVNAEATKGDEKEKVESPSELEADQTELAKPKIKIGSGKQRKRTRNKPKSSSESDIPRYSMRVRPTPRQLSTGGCNLRAQIAINYQETYDYRTGRSTSKPKTPPIPPAALTAPTEARQAAQAAIKDPTLLGATPAQTIPVLVLHNNTAADSDNTVIYEDSEDTPAPPPSLAGDQETDPVTEPEPETLKDKQKV